MTVASVRYTPFWIPLDFCELVDVSTALDLTILNDTLSSFRVSIP